MAARFATNDPEKFIHDIENQNTLKKTLAHVKLLQEFVSAKYKVATPMHLIPVEDLNKYISDFVINVRKTDGGEYEPSYLRGFVSSFDRQLRRHRYGKQIMSNDTAFSESRDALRMKQRELKAQGKGSKPMKAHPLTDDEINKLYLSNQLGIKTPTSLINTLWYLNTLHFGIRGGSEEHRHICWGDVVLKNDPVNKTDYLEFHERATKTRTGEDIRNTRVCAPRMYATPENRERCPVHTYMMYQAKRPSDYCKPDDPFYLAVVTNNPNPSVSEKWFLRGPIGKNKIEQIMKKMAINADLPDHKRITNTSVRKTLVQKMTDANVPDSLQVYVTGHKSIPSLNNYRELNDAHKFAISNVLSNTNSHHESRALTFGPTLAGHDQTAQITQRSSTSTNTAVFSCSPRKMMNSLFSNNTIHDCTFNFNINSTPASNNEN